MANKTLVAYFSASGVSARVAEKIAKATSGDLFEITPEKKYTSDDLNWNNPQSRSSIEMKDKSFRPPVASKVEDMTKYDKIYIGFPIWWGVAPTVVNTFLEGYDLSGKEIVVFATSGGSGIGNTVEELKTSAPNAKWGKAERLNAQITQEEVDAWVNV